MHICIYTHMHIELSTKLANFKENGSALPFLWDTLFFYRCSVCLSNSKQLFHNQTVLMTSHYFDFDAVTHSINDVLVSTLQSLASSELFRIHGCIAHKSLSERETEFRSGTWAKRICLERLLSSCRSPLRWPSTMCVCVCVCVCVSVCLCLCLD